MKKDKDLSLNDVTKVVDDKLIPSGSRIYDTSKSEKGRQIYPRQPSSKIIKDIKEEMGYDAAEDDAGE